MPALPALPATVVSDWRRCYRRRLAAMTPSQRLDAARRRFTPAQRAVWAAAYPEEVPLLNGEVEWIALRLADLD